MCGIAGFTLGGWEPGVAADVLLEEMSSRGPDGGWWRAVDGWCLAQTRLAVVDLSDAVRYPMGGEDGDVLLVFNGEVYNHRELRSELARLGHAFTTACDAEVVVHGYEEWGTDVFGRLNAMFALALLDRRTGDVVLARDERGIKPLVRTTSGPPAFASDALALVAAGLVPGRLDLDALDEYLAFHYVPEPRTGLQGLVSVEPGTAVLLRPDGREEVLRWDEADFAGTSVRLPPVTVEEAEQVLLGAVTRQLQADVEVGVFLSGGIDSALVLDLAREAGARPTAFTVGFAASGDYDETAAAAALAERLHVPHVVERLDVDFDEAVTEVGRAFDVPVGDESAIATLPLSRTARQQVTVALSGTGGDDLFAGYYRHRAPALTGALRHAPAPALAAMARRSPDRGAERRSAGSLAASYASRLARLAASADGRQLYLDLVGTSTSPVTMAALAWRPDLQGARQGVAERLDLRSSRLDDLQRFELRTYLPGCILRKEDRTSMAHGLEARVPLLDDEVVTLAMRTPPAQRAGVTSGKRLLREIARRRLPGRPGRKRGFAVPLRDLFDGPWAPQAREWLHDSRSELVNGPVAARLLGRPDVAPLEMWAVIALMAWEQRLELARQRGVRVAAAAPQA